MLAACSPAPSPVAVPPTPNEAASIASAASSSRPVADRNPSAVSPIAAIAKILTPSGYAGEWDTSRLWILSYDENDGSVDLVCGMRDDDDVSEFLRRLAGSPVFSDVTLLRATHDDAHQLQAEIVAKVPANGYLRITPATKSKIDFGKGNRDPFELIAPAHGRPHDPDLAGTFDLDQLRLIAIIDSDTPRAMFMDPAENSWIVKVGDHVGRVDAVAACSWRVAEVKPENVLMTRVDAAACTEIPSQRVFRIAKRNH